MSYDIWLEIDTGGSEWAMVGDTRNHTSNTAGMWAKALGCSLGELHGRLAGECVGDLERAVAHMRDPGNAAEYAAMNPPNGWGSHSSATNYLAWLLEECRRHPRATVRISR